MAFEELMNLKQQLVNEEKAQQEEIAQKAKTECTVEVELLSETIIGAGHGVAGGVNLDVLRDENGYHYIKASTFKGLVREQMEWFNSLEEGRLTNLIDGLLGKSGEETGKLKFWDYDSNSMNDADNEVVRYSTAVDEKTGVAKDGSLRSFTAVREGVKFEGKITFVCDLSEDEVNLLASAVKAIKHIGTLRTRGKGLVQCKLLRGNQEIGGRYV